MENKINVFGKRWTEEVFEGRNQAYGAFDLRRKSDDFTLRGMAGTMSLFTLLIIFMAIHSVFKTEPLPITNILTPSKVLDGLMNKENLVFEWEKAAAATSHPENTIPKIVPDKKLQVESNPIAKTETTIIGTGTSVSGETGNQHAVGGNSETVNSGSETSEIIDFPESMPEFEGGFEALQQFISTHLQYPNLARENGISGKILIKFTVQADGHIGGIEIIGNHRLGWGCEEEAVRVVELMPKWHPGMQNGKAVPVYYTLPVVFSLN